MSPRRVRANAFDVTRTDRDEATVTPLSSLLPRVRDVAPDELIEAPPTTIVNGAPDAQIVRPVTLTGAGAATEEANQSPPLSPPRGTGGRPARATGRITATAARVPVELYAVVEQLVKGPGRPSWGQLIAWTCQTRRDEVVSEVLEQLRPPEGLVPRGQNKQARATTQITARFTLPEHGTFLDTLEAARSAAEKQNLMAPATATAVVIAALEVAGR